MTEEGAPPSKRVKLSKGDLQRLSKEELLERCQEQTAYIDSLLLKHSEGVTNEEVACLRESEEKLKQQHNDATRRENVLVMRLANKEQELQECLKQIQEIQQAQNPSTAQLRTMLLDPAINVMFQRMKKEMDNCKEKVEQAQNDLAAWKFTPDSQTGKRLMARCRMLLQENEELGKVISSGKTAKLDGEIALQKKFVEEMKKSQLETDEFLVDVDEEVEGMQGTIYFLQQQLKETKEQLAKLQQDNQQLQASIQGKDSLSQAHTNTGSSSTSSSASHLPASIDNYCSDSVVAANTGNVASSNHKSEMHSADARTSPDTKPCVDSYHHRPQTTNGDHHVAMETDTSDGQQESCDDSSWPEQQSAPISQQTSGVHNHGTYRTSQSSTDGVYGLDGTDASSDAWSPTHPSTKQATDAISDEQDPPSDQYHKQDNVGLLTGGDNLQNGVVDSQEEEP